MSNPRTTPEQPQQSNPTIPNDGGPSGGDEPPQAETPPPPKSNPYPGSGIREDSSSLRSDESSDEPKVKAKRKPKADKPPKPTVDTKPTWEAYLAAYKGRYGVEPLRDMKANGQMMNFVKRVGQEAAPAIARFYLAQDEKYYVDQRHTVGVMLVKADSLHTSHAIWAAGREQPKAPPTSQGAAGLSQQQRGNYAPNQRIDNSAVGQARRAAAANAIARGEPPEHDPITGRPIDYGQGGDDGGAAGALRDRDQGAGNGAGRVIDIGEADFARAH